MAWTKENGAAGLIAGITNWKEAWVTSTAYKIGDGVQNDGSAYVCIAEHTSGATTEPGTGASWATYWSLLAEKGSQGTQGNQGTTGVQGINGSQGSQGVQGSQGAQGDAGGPQGPQGVQGAQGDSGAQGSQGSQGTQGEAGAQGSAGSQGAQGSSGEQGATGSQGAQGNQGIQGENGAQGETGAQGTQGAQGNQGNQGDQGAQGDQGSASTVQGPQGNQGNQGNQGSQGAQGTAGGSTSWKGEWSDSTAYEVNDAVSINGSSYICTQNNTNQQPPNATYWNLLAQVGSQGNQGVQGATGSQGDTGAQGATGEQGSQGATGTQGNQGVQGATGEQGTQGETGTQGTQGSQGNQGVQGTQGAQGVQGTVATASIAETNTGTDEAKAVTPDGLSGSNFGIRYVQITCFDYATNVAIGDGKGYLVIPAALNGMNLVSVHAKVITAGTTNTTDIQIANVTDSVDMLSTKITIDSGETGSDTAATAAVIDTSHDDVATNDLLRIDVDAASTTVPKGLIVTLGFQLP